MKQFRAYLLEQKAHFTALILAVLLSLGVTAPATAEVTDAPECKAGQTRVISMNLRCKDDFYGKVKDRARFAVAILEAYAPDSFGVQEATAQWLALLDEALGETYSRVGESRDSTKNTEYSAVYYRTDKFDLLDSGTSWLSETPDAAGSKSFLSSLPRICTWAVLQNKETGKVYTHLNTHLDHVLECTRQKQAAVFVKKAKELEASGPVVCTGDFNTEEGAKAYRVVAAEFDDAKLIADETDSGKTFHDYGRELFSKSKPIDFVFVSRGTPVSRYRIIDTMVNGMYYSDHYALCADIEL